MGRKLRMCSRKYRHWKKRSPKKVKTKEFHKRRSPKKVATLERSKNRKTPQKSSSQGNVTHVERSTNNAIPTILSLHGIIEQPQGWYDHTTPNFNEIHLCKVIDIAISSSQPLVITHSIIKSDFSLKLFVLNREVTKCSALSDMPSQLDDT